jgi:hypothetical protein
MTKSTVYTIRLADTGSKILPGDHYAPQKIITLAPDLTRDQAVAEYDRVRSETHRQQVTLYAPRGNRIREAWGTA